MIAELIAKRTKWGIVSELDNEKPTPAKGNGGVEFASNEIASYRANFLLRSRSEFLKHGSGSLPRC